MGAVDPIAIQMGGFSIHWYGVLVALGFAAGLWTASRRAPLTGFSPEVVFDLGPWLILGAVVGARVFYVISYWETQFAGKPFYEVFMVHHGGLVYYGGLVGSSLAYIIFARWKRLPMWRLADVLAPSVALGYVFGRVGCLMNGCCFGRACELPWGVQYPSNHETHPAHVHPSPIYDSLLSLALYLGLAWLYRHKKHDGQVFSTYLVGYALVRSFVELFRGDYPRYIAGWITPAHLLSALILFTGIVLLILGSKNRLPGAQPRT